MRKFALTQLVSLMKAGKVSDGGDVDILGKLYQQYLGYLHKLQNGTLITHHELVLTLLGSLFISV